MKTMMRVVCVLLLAVGLCGCSWFRKSGQEQQGTPAEKTPNPGSEGDSELPEIEIDGDDDDDKEKQPSGGSQNQQGGGSQPSEVTPAPQGGENTAPEETAEPSADPQPTATPAAEPTPTPESEEPGVEPSPDPEDGSGDITITDGGDIELPELP